MYGRAVTLRGPRLRSWTVAAPLALAGSQMAHSVAYRVAPPQGGVRMSFLACMAHGYLTMAPYAAAGVLAVLIGALALHARAASAGRCVGRVAAWPFMLLPPLVFTLQEFLPQLSHSATMMAMAGGPRFLPGLLLQLPIALIAYAVARALTRIVVAAARARLLAQAPPLVRRPSQRRPALPLVVLAWTVPAGSVSRRGPPLSLSRI